MNKLNDILLALLVVAVADIVLFHYGVYFAILQPESYSGRVEQQGRRLAGMLEAAPDRDGMVVIGNSQAQATIQEAQLEAELSDGGQQFRVINQAVGGSSPSAWYFLLQSDWFPKDTTKIVVLAVNNTSILAFEGGEQRDLDISKTRLGIGDAAMIARTHHGLEDRLAAFSGVLFRTLLFRDDAKQYLRSPSERHRQIAEHKAVFERRLRNGARSDNRSNNTLLSARLGEDNRLVMDELAPFIKAKKELTRRVERQLRRRQKTLDAIARGKKVIRHLVVEPSKISLLGRLVAELNEQGIRVVFCVIPSSPFALNRPVKVDHLGNLFRDLKQQGRDIEVWHDSDVIRRLNSPEFFKDPLHLNAAGAEIYTRGLASFLVQTLSETESPI